MNYEFKFDIGSRVKYTHNSLVNGYVVSLVVDRNKNTWVELEYMDANGTIQREYFIENQIELL